MDLALLVYGISVLHNINILAGIILVCSVIAVALAFIVYMCDPGEASAKLVLKYTLQALLVSSIFASIIPGEKTMYNMVAAYAAQKVSEDPKVQQLSAKVLKLVESKLDTYIAEATAKQGK